MDEILEVDKAVYKLSYALRHFVDRLRSKMLDADFEPEIYVTQKFWADIRSSVSFRVWYPQDQNKHSFQGCAVHLVYEDDWLDDFQIVAVFK